MLLLTIRKGTTPDAQQERTCYYNAYECSTIQDTAETVTVLTWHADSLPVWLDMEHNTVTDYTTDQDTIIAAVMAA